MKPVVLTLAFFLALSSEAPAQIQKTRLPLRVSVSVDGDDIIKSEVLSRVNSGLRALGDVVVVDDDPKLQVSIVAVRDTSVGGRELGYTLSLVVTKGFQRKEVRPVIRAWAKNEAAEHLLVDYFGNGVTLVHHSVISGGELQEVCKRAVASIDVGPVEYERKYWQDIEDNTRRLMELKKKYPDKSFLELQEIIDREKKKP